MSERQKGHYWAREGKGDPWAIFYFDEERWWIIGWDVPLREDEVRQLTDVIEIKEPPGGGGAGSA